MLAPFSKKGNKNSAENYRPVSLTSIICKLLEHIIFSSIATHLEKYSILSPIQHGFRCHHSCESQLVGAIDDCARARVIDRKSQVDVAILDFSKAFDTVPHQRLLQKLLACGIGGTTYTWIKSFLVERYQRVQINGSHSSWLPVLSGVPQGTVLGPLLFLIYINDLTNNLQSDIRLFADDCILYREVKNSSDSAVLQSDLDALCSWEEKWQMKFNKNKCHVMHITNKTKPISYNYKMSSTTLSAVQEYPYLGVTIQNNLKWSSHINKICSKANKTLGLLKRNINKCTRETKEIAYFSLVRPHLEYASPAWDPHYVKDVRSIEYIQRRSARFVKSDYRLTSSVTAMLHDLSWPTLQSRRSLCRLALFYKAVNNLIAVPVDNLCIATRATRQNKGLSKVFTPISATSDAYKFSFFPRTIKDWNSLSDKIRNCNDTSVFIKTASSAVLQFY